MAIKKYKSRTPGRRGMTSINYREVLSKSEPHKSLTKGKKSTGGRNARGRITTRHKGSGAKRLSREIDFKMGKKNIPFTITSVEYDPNRSGFIGLVTYSDGEKRYMLLPQNVKVGEKKIISEEAPVETGNRVPLKTMPIGTMVYNVEIKPEGGAKLIRSAGNYGEVLAKDAGYVDIKMPSTEVRKIREDCFASVGMVSNPEKRLVRIGKAGRKRHMGVRPTVRGVAMNPVDHPQGGGEARSRGRRKHTKTKWGRIVDPGIKTRKPGKYSDSHIVSKRKSKRRK